MPPAPASAHAELLHLAKVGGWKQANLQIAEVAPRLHDPAWEPLWKTLEETGIILSFHVTVFNVAKDNPAFGTPASTFVATKEFVGQFLDPFVDLFAWGILERHPRMRVTMAESGLGWVPWVVQELDTRFGRLHESKSYWDRHGGVPLAIPPSELFKRQIYASFQDDPIAIALLPFMGEGHVMWASDYPHPTAPGRSPNKKLKIRWPTFRRGCARVCCMTTGSRCMGLRSSANGFSSAMTLSWRHERGNATQAGGHRIC